MTYLVSACAMSLLCVSRMHVCGSLTLWMSFVFHGVFVQPCTMNRVGHAQGVCVWITRNNDVANACKQDARGIGKARAGKCRAWAQNGHAQVGAWCAQARKHTCTQRVLLTLVFRDVCGGADCMWNMYSAQSKEHAGGLCLDHLGCDFSAQVSF